MHYILPLDKNIASIGLFLLYIFFTNITGLLLALVLGSMIKLHFLFHYNDNFMGKWLNVMKWYLWIWYKWITMINSLQLNCDKLYLQVRISWVVDMSVCWSSGSTTPSSRSSCLAWAHQSIMWPVPMTTHCMQPRMMTMVREDIMTILLIGKYFKTFIELLIEMVHHLSGDIY